MYACLRTRNNPSCMQEWRLNLRYKNKKRGNHSLQMDRERHTKMMKHYLNRRRIIIADFFLGTIISSRPIIAISP